MHGYGYGAPPPYCAPQPPYNAYGGPPPPYGAPQAPAYGAPYGAPLPQTYGAPSPYGAQPTPQGLPPPAPFGPPSTSPSPSPSAANQPQPQSSAPSAPVPSAPQQPPPANGSSAPPSSYPSLTAPPPTQNLTYNPPTGASVPPDSASRPASAAPGPSPYAAPAWPTYPYGAPAVAPQQATAPYTYGQRPALSAPPPYGAPPAAAPYGAPPPTAVPQPYMPPTTYAPAPGHGGRRRRALLIGCSYPGTSAALNGCLNDVQCIQFCLTKRFGFTDSQIVVLRDDSRHPDFISTKMNIYRGIQWLMTDQRPGDSLFFHFSGHGSQQYDRNGDEDDGYDETICPTDFKSAGQIVDDELHRLMVRPLMPGVTLHAVVDACHSGTALDLPYRAKVDGVGRWYWKGRGRYDKMTMGGTAFQFGACKDSQVAQDTKLLSGRTYTGAATYCFIEAIEKYGIQQTYGQILSHMMTTLRSATGAPGLNLGMAGSLIAGFLLGSAASMLSLGGQTPVLSCDKQIDLYNTQLSL